MVRGLKFSNNQKFEVVKITGLLSQEHQDHFVRTKTTTQAFCSYRQGASRVETKTMQSSRGVLAEDYSAAGNTYETRETYSLY